MVQQAIKEHRLISQQLQVRIFFRNLRTFPAFQRHRLSNLQIRFRTTSNYNLDSELLFTGESSSNATCSLTYTCSIQVLLAKLAQFQFDCK